MKIIINAKIDDTNELYNLYFTDKVENIVLSKEDTLDESLAKIDIEGKILIPGGIDSHVHFNDPGFTHQEDFTTGTTSAALGGITTIVDMPCTSMPPVTNKKNLLNKLEKIEKKAVVDFAFWGGINGGDEIDLNTLKELKESGATAFKIYTISGMPTYQALSYEKIDKLFNLAKDEDFIFAFHAEDLNIIESSINNLKNGEEKTVEGYLKSRPTEAETESIKSIIDIAKKYNTKIHIVHISSKEGLELVRSYKYATSETCPHYLEFTEMDLHTLKGRLKTAPVVKSEKDKIYLRESVLNGKIDFIVTDHAGTNYEKNKLSEDFSKVYNGIPGTQFMIPYLFTSFYDSKEVNLKRMIEITSTNSAKLYGLYPKKGCLNLGSDADSTILEKKDFIVDEKNLASKGKYSPFNGKKFSYQINKTVLRGEIIFDINNKNISNVNGKFIKSKRSMHEY